MHVYRRPFDYQQQHSRVSAFTLYEWPTDLLSETLEIKTYPVTIGVSPTFNLTLADLEITTYPVTVSLAYAASLSTQDLSITTYPVTIQSGAGQWASQNPGDSIWTNQSGGTETWTPASDVSTTWT